MLPSLLEIREYGNSLDRAGNVDQDSRKATVSMYKNIIWRRNSIVYVYVGR